MKPAIDIPQAEIEAFCKRHHIRRLALFGSVLRDDFGPDSDVDVLVEYEEGAVVTLLDMAGQEIELGELTGYKIDLRTAQDLSHYFRQQVVDTAVPVYE
jgi:predicted nucleotidyltransferase